MKRVLTYYLRPYYLRMCLGFVIKFGGTIMDLCLPWILAHMIDVVIPKNSKKMIFAWGVLMVICAILAWTGNVIANRMASKVARDTTEHVRHDLFSKITYLSNQSTDAFTKPSLISRLTSDTYNLHQMLGRVQRLGVRAPILLIGGILITLTLDPVLTLILVSVLPFIVIVMTTTSRRGIPMYARLQEALDQFVRLVREDIAGIRVIKALSKTDYERERFGKINEEVVKIEKKAGMTMAIVNPSMNFFLNIGLVLVIIAGAYRVNSGLSEVGKILAFMTYFTIILNAMMSISKMFVIISKAVASADRIVAVLDAHDERDLEIMESKAREEEQKQSMIAFDHVSFSYNHVENNLTDISFSIKKGETLGIIGETGSGKSTIVSLLLRFYDATEGTILINGKPIQSLPVEELRKHFGVVFQNDALFEDTITENVRLGRDLTEDQIRQAILYAQAKEFVEDENRGYYDKLNIKGANLSGGQKQRILIARALAAHPDILILDDSSSALDYRTDASLRKELREHFKNTTTVIIAQRISSIMHADHILVLEDGAMIGYGTHEELLLSCPVYQEIGRSQMGIDTEAS
ncbi:MAG: ABC transporter ATP-binding protein [Lachnospiraceae bacterium]|nr:ABC transporter ATP-binding protein [Lachnospiraceae bacterium]